MFFAIVDFVFVVSVAQWEKVITSVQSVITDLLMRTILVLQVYEATCIIILLNMNKKKIVIRGILETMLWIHFLSFFGWGANLILCVFENSIND